MFQRALGPLPLADTFPNIARQGAVVEHVQVGVEEFPLLWTQVLGHLGIDALDIVPGLTNRPVEEGEFGFHVLGIAVRYQLQPRSRQYHIGGADADARNTRDAMETRLALFRAIGTRQQAVDIARRFRMGNEPRHLGREGDQEGDFFFEIATRLAILHDQHAEHFPDVDDRHAEECLEGLLAHPQHLVVAIMLGGVLQVDGLGPFRNQPHDPFGRPEGHASHQIRVESFVGDEDETPRGTVAQVDRADLRIEDHRHPGDEQVQRGTEPGRGTHVLNNLSQCVEHRRLSSSRPRAGRHWGQRRASTPAPVRAAPGGTRRA